MEDADRVVGLYERHALAFDRIRGRDLFEKHWLDRFTATLPAGSTVLDIGCGSGEPMAAELITRGYRLTGVDSSATLIGLCRARFPEHGWHVGDMRRLALDARFDALLAWHSFFHLTGEEQRAMFARFAAHAADGAMLMFTSGPAEGEAIGTFEGEPLYHASLAPDDYQRLLEGHGFELLALISEDPACGGATVWLARRA
ncbi:class I SAM-dependent methyltransferase [Agrobacterium sp. a22-2]|uniref:class I SAM-dependent DNA methyltransferase n=1 Tax=Agrobacterium sp. a22-2 TaxID=2283840 RepID=UPI0014453E98|nr:class I SAM-dependent methyltransferase [Agrobacterium sp. a22-2]NKN38578.1 class I SAM-dependent methyltransferase [Agrobacterium sp. a22-2]